MVINSNKLNQYDFEVHIRIYLQIYIPPLHIHRFYIKIKRIVKRIVSLLTIGCLIIAILTRYRNA